MFLLSFFSSFSFSYHWGPRPSHIGNTTPGWIEDPVETRLRNRGGRGRFFFEANASPRGSSCRGLVVVMGTTARLCLTLSLACWPGRGGVRLPGRDARLRRALEYALVFLSGGFFFFFFKFPILSTCCAWIVHLLPGSVRQRRTRPPGSNPARPRHAARQRSLGNRGGGRLYSLFFFFSSIYTQYNPTERIAHTRVRDKPGHTRNKVRPRPCYVDTMYRFGAGTSHDQKKTTWTGDAVLPLRIAWFQIERSPRAERRRRSPSRLAWPVLIRSSILGCQSMVRLCTWSTRLTPSGNDHGGD